jgi:hypothetical protein
VQSGYFVGRGAGNVVPLPDTRRVEARNESGPRYVSHYHVRALRQEGFCILEGICDGLRHGRGEFDAPLSFVVGDLQVECREYPTLNRGLGIPQRLAQVGDPRELLSQLLVFDLLTLGAYARQGLLQRLLLPAKLTDPLGDQLGLDPLLQGLDLRLDLAIQLGDLLADPRTGELAVSALVTMVSTKLFGELVETHRTEDPLFEEANYESLKPVLAHRDALLTAVGLKRRGRTVVGCVGAGVVVMALAALPCIESGWWPAQQRTMPANRSRSSSTAACSLARRR